LGFILGLIALKAVDFATQPACRDTKVRKEWRIMSHREQQEYIEAIKCLMEAPSLSQPGSSRWDDFAFAHTKEGSNTHYSGQFLTWHRVFLMVYQRVLADECAFQGALP
jgi:tyrosinase